MTTQQKLIDSARHLIQTRGYNGFSYADVADEVQVRKASIHHHFPAKSDLARAVVEESRAVIVEQTRMLDGVAFDPDAQLRMYTGYWEKCIMDASAPFCICALLAGELPLLPDQVSMQVRAHFRSLAGWLTSVLERGAAQGRIHLNAPARVEAETFMATVHGAMLSARAYGDPRMFATIATPLIERYAARH